MSGDRILVGLKVTGSQAAAAGEKDRWQVLTVRSDRITEITGFDDRDEAAAHAGLAATAARPARDRQMGPARQLTCGKSSHSRRDTLHDPRHPRIIRQPWPAARPGVTERAGG